MNILITGGTGFIGMNIAEALLREGHRVVLAARTPPDAHLQTALQMISDQVIYENLDIMKQEMIGEVLDRNAIDHVIHAAVITPGADREKQESARIIQTNYMGTVALLEEVKKRQIRRFIYLSSASVYGAAFFSGDMLYEDENITVPKPATLYEISKFAAEKTVLRYKQLFEMDAVIARVGATFGPWERYTGVRDTLSSPFIALQYASNGLETTLPAEGFRDWVYSRDIANAISAILVHEAPSYDIYNLSSGYVWSIDEFCTKLKKFYPEFSHSIKPGYKGPGYVELYVYPDRCPMDIHRLVGDIGYTPHYDINCALEDYIRWLREGNEWVLNG